VPPEQAEIAVSFRAEWLTGQGRAGEAQPLLAEARNTFERLEARPWLERLESIQNAVSAAIPA
jgi:hypothetical protein